MKRFIKNFALYLVIFAVVLGVAFFYKGADGAKKTAEVKFSTFATHLEKGKYKTINITDRKMTATLKNGNKEYAYAPSVVEISWLENSYVFPQVKSGKLKLSSDPPQSSVKVVTTKHSSSVRTGLSCTKKMVRIFVLLM